jgi:predicted metalloendopeptidase
MKKTVKYISKNTSKQNITKKNVLEKKCPIGLKPFEFNFSKSQSITDLKKTSTLKKKEFVKELLSKFAPRGIKPTDNYYDYINYQWLQNVSVENQQKYITQVDDFRLVQDKVYRDLNDIILDYIKKNNNKLARNLKNYYTSVVKMNDLDYSKELSKEVVLTIDKFIQENNVWKLLAFINKDEMLHCAAPFVWTLNPDEMEPNIFRCYVSGHQFSILDIEVYYDDGTNIEYKKKYRNAFKNYCKTLFDTCIGPNHGLNPDDVYDVEVDIFNVMGCVSVTRKEEEPYNKILAHECLEKYGFDWIQFSKELGFSKAPSFFITQSLNYLKCGTELMLQNWTSTKWRTYWIWILIRRLARITGKWQHITYDFYGKFQRGQEEIVSLSFLCFFNFFKPFHF